MKINAANLKDCIDRIAAKGKISAQEALDLLQQISDRADKIGGSDPYIKAAAEMAAGLKNVAKRDALDVVRNRLKHDAAFSFVSKDGKDINGAASRLRSLLFYVPAKPEERATENVQTVWHAKANEWGTLFPKLRAAGLLKIAASPDMQDAIAEELQNIRAGRVSQVPANNPARRIAEIAYPFMENIREAQNNEGAHIANANDYIAHMSHDTYLMRRGGRGQPIATDWDEAFQRWWKVIEPKLDEKTFADVAPQEGERPGHVLEGPIETEAQSREAFGKRAFNAMVTGVRKGKAPDEVGYVPREYEGTSNLARKLSEGRLFVFKDAKSWSDYNKLYGKHTNMLALFNDAINYGARNYGLLRVLGTNPEAMINKLQSKLQTTFRDTDPEGVVNFQRDIGGAFLKFQPKLDDVLQLLKGSGNTSGDYRMARLGATIREFYDMLLLGPVGLTHLTAAAMTFTSEARIHGVTSFEGLGRMLKAVVPEWMKGQDRADLLSDLGAYGDGATRELFDPYNHGSTVPGYLADFHSRFMHATSLPYLLSHFKAGIREMLANFLGRQRTTPFNALDLHLQNKLLSYGINHDEWELLRNGPTTTLPNGNVYLTPQNALDADAGKIESILRARGKIGPTTPADEIADQVERFQQSLSDHLMMYMTDSAEHAVVTPGVRERAIFGATHRGTFTGEMLGAVTQYKSWPLAAMHQILGREIYERTSKLDAMQGIGVVLATTVLAGYIRMAVRNMASGKEPPMPQNGYDAMRLGMQAATAGGGLGIAGDLLFGGVGKQGNFSSLGGPMTEDGAELAKMGYGWFNDLGSQKPHNYWPELAKWGMRHIPFVNLIYLKGVWDYMVYYHVMEAISPGWWERTNRTLERNGQQPMMGYKPGMPIPYTPYGVGAGQQ